jgi:hypothetical protein
VCRAADRSGNPPALHHQDAVGERANLVEIGRNEEDRDARLLQRQGPPMNGVTRRDRPRGPEVPRATLAAELPEGVVISEPLRQAYFGPVHGWRDTRVVNRTDLVDRSKGLV